ICAWPLKLCLSLESSKPHRHGGPLIVRWQWLVWLTWRRVCLHGCGPSLPGQTLRLACWVIFLQLCLFWCDRAWLSPASRPLCMSRMPSAPGQDCCFAPDNSGWTRSDRCNYSFVMAMESVRLITFDCYGTLIDWEKGMLKAMRPLFGNNDTAHDIELLALYG